MIQKYLTEFLTGTIYNWGHPPGKDDFKNIVVSSFQWLTEKKRCTISAFVLMPNHIRDHASDKKFPTHFGTGTEDYYGWAGGENPNKDDVFSHPYLANIEVGSATDRRQGVRGFTICTLVRELDAIPFTNKLVFDMEASPGVDIRNPWDFLSYSSVVFWYARPGAVSNRPPLPGQAAKPIITLKKIDSMEIEIKKKQKDY
ncbi:MAG: DUF2961 domain-containing protein [Ginsengibacter sp.]